MPLDSFNRVWREKATAVVGIGGMANSNGLFNTASNERLVL